MSITKTKQRLDYLDNIKWVLIFMVIAHHTCIAFGGPGGGGYYSVPVSSELSKNIFGLYLGFQQSYFMTLFFAISSYFLIPSLVKKGNKQFIIDRLKRLGIPLLFMIIILVPIMKLWQDYLYEKPLTFSINIFDADQMWFVRTLLIFTFIALIYWTIFGSEKNFKKIQKPNVLSHKNIAIFIITLTVIQVLALLLIPKILPKEILNKIMPFFSASGINDAIIYMVYFYIGIRAWRERWLETLSIKTTIPWFVVALILYFSQIPLYFMNVDNIGSIIVNDVGRPLICTGICLFMVAFFKRYFNKHTKLTKNLALAAYTAYIFQRPFITIATLIVEKFHLSSIPSFLIAALFAVIATFFVSHFIRKLPIVRNIL